VNPGRCVEGRANASRVTPRVILVLDGSCSMSTSYPANGEQSASECVENANGRWAALRRALIDPQIGIVPKLQGIVQFGAVTFGTEPQCPIPGTPVQPALNNLAMIQTSVPPIQPGQFTPSGEALDWVYENMIVENRPDSDNGPQIVILATDGEPNSCGGGGGGRNMTNYQPSIDAIRKGRAKGAVTYIISLADATGTFRDHLQQLANLGNTAAMGSAKLYEPASPEQLVADLQLLVGGAIGCDIALNGTVQPANACAGTVTLNGVALPCEGADGWTLVDGGRRIRLQGAACELLMAQNGLVEAKFPCTAFEPD
jgi:hypothetical protein